MANAIYPLFKQALLNKEHDLNTDEIHALLVDGADYSYSAAHDYVDDVAAGARVSSFGPLLSPTITTGAFDAADFAFSSVTGDQAEIIILYNHGMSGADTGRGLIAYYDTGITGMPVTPNGGDINCTVHSSGFFSL